MGKQGLARNAHRPEKPLQELAVNQCQKAEELKSNGLSAPASTKLFVTGRNIVRKRYRD